MLFKLIKECSSNYYNFLDGLEFQEKIITDKAPLNFRWIGFIKLFFPNAKIVHCFRNNFNMLLGIRGTSNTISNSSTIRGWMESTGLDDIFMSTCSCILGEEEPPTASNGMRGGGGAASQPQGAGGRRNKRVVKAAP